MTNKIKVIYILGSGHSGSTLLDLILGSHSYIESAGEIDRFWRYILQQPAQTGEKERICTCGQRIDKCQYWNKVRYELKQICGKTEINPESENTTQFIENNYYFIKAVLGASGKKIFCDSSKNCFRLDKFLNSNLFDVQIVHLIRDGRAVAFSLKKKGERISNNNVYDYYQAIKLWKKQNLNYQHKYEKSANYLQLKYEDLVRYPKASVEQILAKLSLEFEPGQLSFSEYDHHNIGGNRMRMKRKQEIKRDINYLQNLSFKEWWIGTTLGFSAIKSFGYSFRK